MVRVQDIKGCLLYTSGQIVAGAYRKNTHDVVDIESCMIEEQESDEIIRDIKDMLRSFRIKTYDEDTGYGLLRHVLVRKGYATGQKMCIRDRTYTS